MSTTDVTSNESAFRAIGWGQATAQPTPRDGQGVTVAVLDWGFDLLHPALRKPDGRTRFIALLDQNAAHGGLLGGDRIDELIAAAAASGSRQPADAVYDPHANYYDATDGAYGAHGTAMASIAAGSPHGAFTGLAPAADLIGIQLAHGDTDWKEVDRNGTPTWTHWNPARDPCWDGWRTYLESDAIAAAIEEAWHLATQRRDAALVINLSIGSWAGAHDGNSQVERKIADVTQRCHHADAGPVTSIVLTAGNAASLNQHFQSTIGSGNAGVFQWLMGPADPTPNKIEIWYRGTRDLEVTLTAPGGDRFELRQFRTEPIVAASRLVGIADHVAGASGELSRVRIILHPPYFPKDLPQDASGRYAWMVACRVPDGSAPAELHAWIERDDGEVEHSEVSPASGLSTLSGIACARGALIVAGFDHRNNPAGGREAISGRGPHPWLSGTAGHVPHVAAPGHRITAARSKTCGYVPTSGTSPAGALASGAMAVAMGRALTACSRGSDQRRAALHRAMRAIACGRGEPWCPSRGRGAIDLATAVREVTQ